MNMNFETITSTPLAEKLSDQSEFEQVIDLISETDVTVYEALNNTRPEAREEFFANPDLVHPHNEYGNLDPEKVAHNLEILRQVHDNLSQNTLSDKQKRLVRLLADDYFKKNDFLAANIAYDTATTPEDKTAAAEYHRETNEALYGAPDEKVFNSLLVERLRSIQPGQLRPDDQARYEMLLEAIGPLDLQSAERFEPKPETVERFSELVNYFYADFFDAIPQDQDTFTAQEAADIINRILTENFHDSSYSAVVSPSASNASVDHMTRQVKFPATRAGGDYDRKSLKKLLAHELGTHTYRAIPYEGASISAFSHELPGNEVWDEGIAKCIEQAVSGERQTPGVDHYINIGLATFKGKNFREVYEIQTMLDFLRQAKPNETEEVRAARMKKIQITAFNRTQRCFRGTDELPNNKDLAYYNGTDMAWQYIEEYIDDPELFTNLFLAGKSVIGNIDQERLVYEMRTGGL